MNIEQEIINDVLNIYRDAIRNVRNPSRNFNLHLSRYYNNPPVGGYEVNEEHEYILPDNDDITASVLLEIVTRFGTRETDSVIRRSKIKGLGKYHKIPKESPLTAETCPICIDNFKEHECYRTLSCSHSFHKRCIDRWFRKDHSDCPMCRTKII
jgi:hypothetical protein